MHSSVRIHQVCFFDQLDVIFLQLYLLGYAFRDTRAIKTF